MDSSNTQIEGEKEKGEELSRRFSTIINKWGDVPTHYKTILKLLPMFIILAAIPLTVRLSQTQQNLQEEAAQKCHGNNKFCITPTPISDTSVWTKVVDDEFNTSGIPTHWKMYNGPYGSGPHNCAAPSQDFVSGGYLNLLMSYLQSGNCGVGWYTGGISLSGFSSVDQRITLRYRVIPGPGWHSHFIIPMRWPDIDSSWPSAGEEDYNEGNWQSGTNTYLHYGSNNSQVSSPTYTFDNTQWHTIQTTRLNNTVTITLDGSIIWKYTGNTTTLPDTLKHVVLQQECSGNTCPSGTTGTETIQIDWITVENPS